MVTTRLTAHGTPVPDRWKSLLFVLFLSVAISLLASMAAGYSLIWHLTITTSNTVILALGMGMYSIPGALLGPFIGPLIDRYDRKILLVASEVFLSAASLISTLVVIFGQASVPFVFTLLVIRGIGQAFQGPSFQAMVPLIVPEEHLGRVNGLSQTIIGGGAIISPPLGVLLYTIFGLQATLIFHATGAALAAVILMFARLPGIHLSIEQRTGVISEFLEGARSVRAVRGLGLLFLFVMFGILIFQPVNALWPLLVHEHFGGGGFEVSLSEIFFGSGFLIGSIILGIWGGGRHLIRLVLLSCISQGLIVFAISQLPSSAFLWFLPPAVFLGLVWPFMQGPLNATVQKRIEPLKLGRVMALLNSLINFATPLGMIVVTLAGEGVKSQTWYLVCGLALTALALCAFIPPSIRGLDKYDPRSM
ncbi:MAG: MFS transporter [Coriobacteriales bacterium]|nr:MFS transporter [Coriobacteriales bacterium]